MRPSIFQILTLGLGLLCHVHLTDALVTLETMRKLTELTDGLKDKILESGEVLGVHVGGGVGAGGGQGVFVVGGGQGGDGNGDRDDVEIVSILSVMET